MVEAFPSSPSTLRPWQQDLARRGVWGLGRRFRQREMLIDKVRWLALPCSSNRDMLADGKKPVVPDWADVSLTALSPRDRVWTPRYDGKCSMVGWWRTDMCVLRFLPSFLSFFPESTLRVLHVAYSRDFGFRHLIGQLCGLKRRRGLLDQRVGRICLIVL
jgi:hypothetical protein